MVIILCCFELKESIKGWFLDLSSIYIGNFIKERMLTTEVLWSYQKHLYHPRRATAKAVNYTYLRKIFQCNKYFKIILVISSFKLNNFKRIYHVFNIFFFISNYRENFLQHLTFSLNATTKSMSESKLLWILNRNQTNPFK